MGEQTGTTPCEQLCERRSRSRKMKLTGNNVRCVCVQQEPPFRETKLLPLSPPRSRGWLRSSPISPAVSMPTHSGKLRCLSCLAVFSTMGSPPCYLLLAEIFMCTPDRPSHMRSME